MHLEVKITIEWVVLTYAQSSGAALLNKSLEQILVIFMER